MPESTPRASSGSPRPFGASLTHDGVNFAVFSRNASSMRLCLYRKPDDGEAYFDQRLDPIQNRTGDIWHIHVEGLKAGAFYAWRADGPYMPEQGHRFNPNKILLDPYAKALTGNFIWDIDAAKAYDPADPRGDLSFSRADDAAQMPKCIVIDDDDFVDQFRQLFQHLADEPAEYRPFVVSGNHQHGFHLHLTSCHRRSR